MAVTIRQSNLFAAEDWKRLYTTFRTADFQSYDYETLRKSMVDYLRTYYPEDFNDYIESSEFVALLDLLAFMGQSLAFRGDLNARENFLATAERRDSVYRLAAMLGYSPKRNLNSHGLLKVVSVSTSEIIRDSAGRNLANQNIIWDDPTNLDWQEQFAAIMNAALQPSQRIGRPSGTLKVGNINHELYQVRLTDSSNVPIFSFSSTVNGRNLPFEVYNIGLDSEKAIYEISPEPSDALGFVFRSDGRGNSSANTGFFFGFKQGTLNNLDFTLNESLTNRLVGLNLDNINNNDVWLFELNDAGSYSGEWAKVDSLKDSNAIYNSSSNRKLYTVSSRLNDQIDLVFGDGIFSDIPVGIFRATVRTSDATNYIITPADMQSVNITITYLSKQNRIETLSIKLALQYTVNNADIREDLADIKINAPQYFYTQNRMINGQDYNVFPYAKFGDIAKMKSVNRTASGISRFLDIKDVTGKYSSTNIFCQDGFIYKTETLVASQFSWINLNDIRRFIRNDIALAIKNKEMLHLYYGNYEKKIPPETIWIRGTAESNSSTGYFANYEGIVQPIGPGSTGNRKFMMPGALIKILAPAGKYFDVDGQLASGIPSTQNQQTEAWVTIVSSIDDGTNNNRGLFDSGIGPVVINKNIPSDAIIDQIYAPYNTEINSALEQTIVNQLTTNQDFGLRYDLEDMEWKIIVGSKLDIENSFDYSTSNTNADSSWFIALVNNGGIYTVYYRGLEYFFGSEIETRFYFDNNVKIFDPRTGRVIKDNIKILQYNPAADGSDYLGKDILLEIYDTIDYPDGFSDDSGIKVTFADSDDDGVPDDPTVFDTVVGENLSLSDLDKLVFLEKYLDYDNLERYRWRNPSTVTSKYATKEEIELNGRFSNPLGTVFYAYGEEAFYQLLLIDDVRTVVFTEDYLVYNGRSSLYFQYRHNSPNDRRIDPSPSNIIDMYILTNSYDKAYRQYLNDSTGKVPEPTAPSVVDLSITYQDINQYKATSDAIVMNPVKYKALFGSKASIDLRATFKVVRSDNTRLTNTQIRNNIIKSINKYFALENWDFGDTFYFSELAAYLHQETAPDVAALVIVPKISDMQFGDFMQIRSRADEILISSATVDDVEIIDSITANKLKAVPGVAVTGGYVVTTRTV